MSGYCNRHGLLVGLAEAKDDSSTLGPQENSGTRRE